MIDDGLSRTVLSVYLKEADYRGIAKLMAAVHAYERAHLAPLGMRVGFAGDVAVSQAMIPAIVRTQVYSLLLALVGCWAVIALLYRSAVTYGVAQQAGHPRPDLKALEETGPAIVIDSGAIALGFGLLAISQVPANERLGLLVGIALVSSSLLTLVGLAALLPVVARRARPAA